MKKLFVFVLIGMFLIGGNALAGKQVIRNDLQVLGNLQADGVFSVTVTDANVTLTSAHFGKSIRMNSASDYIAFLPSVGSSDDGAKLQIVKTGAGKVTIDAADSDKINDSGAGGTIYNNTAAEIYAFIDLEYVHVIVTWVVTGTGTWVTTN